jgi:hypothetical protein
MSDMIDPMAGSPVSEPASKPLEPIRTGAES